MPSGPRSPLWRPGESSRTTSDIGGSRAQWMARVKDDQGSMSQDKPPSGSCQFHIERVPPAHPRRRRRLGDGLSRALPSPFSRKRSWVRRRLSPPFRLNQGGSLRRGRREGGEIGRDGAELRCDRGLGLTARAMPRALASRRQKVAWTLRDVNYEPQLTHVNAGRFWPSPHTKLSSIRQYGTLHA